MTSPVINVSEPALPQGQTGFALLESLIAILIFSIGILAIMGLQAVSIDNSVNAKYRSDASLLANQIIGQMWADAGNLSNYAGSGYAPKTAWITQIGNTLPNGNGTIAVDATNNTVTVTVSWNPRNAGQHTYVTKAQIQL